MHGRSPFYNRHGNLPFTGKALARIIVLVSLALFLPAAGFASFINGGDKLWSFRDQLAGKQNPVASVMDSQGNTIIAGSRRLPGSSSEECYTIKVSPNNTLVWRGVYSKSGFSVRAVAVAVDANDNVYVTGAIDGANADTFTIRYDRDQSGTDAVPAWQMPFDGGGTDTATALAVDGEYVYVGGSSRYAGNECFMVLKYNRANGALLFQVPNAANSTIGKANSIAANGSGVAVTGQSWSGSDLFFKTISYDLDGLLLWEKQYTIASPPQGFRYNDAGRLVRLDSKGHVVATGYVSNGVNADIYTVKFCSGNTPPCDGKNQGDILWEQTYAGPDDAKPDGLHIERQAGDADDVYVTGRTFIDGRYHIYTVRYKSALSAPQESWHAIFSSGSDNHDIPAAMVVSASEDSLYLAGYSEDLAYNDDLRTIKYRKSTGDELWRQIFKGAADKNDRAIGIGLDPGGQVYVAGYSDETVPLDGGVSSATSGSLTTLANSGKNWTINGWAGYFAAITGGANASQSRTIQSNTATTLTFATPLANSVAAGDTYYLYDQDDYDYYVVKYEKGVLEAPSKLVAAPASNSAINLSWQDNNAITPKFRVERCTSGTVNLSATPCDFDIPTEITIVADGITVTSVQDTGLDPDRYYYYRVRAYTGVDFANATLVTYPSNIDHAITQYVGISIPAKTYSYVGVANSDDYALAIAASPVDGRPVVTGKSFFNPGGLDYYTIRLDRDLNRLWSQRYNDPEGQSDVAVCLAVDNNDQVIVSGYAMLMNLAAGKDMNSVYTIKYKANAAPEPEVDTELINEWDHQYNGPGGGDDRAVAIATTTDANNNIAVLGMGLHASTDYQKHDIYLLHYPPNGPGTTVSPNPGYWAATPIHEGDDNIPTAVAFDPWGNVIITGFTGKLSNPADPSSLILYDIYTAKFCGTSTSGCPNGKNPGDLVWKQTYDGLHGDDEANDVVVDEQGNVYVTGFTTNDLGNWDYITLKYDRDGNVQAGWPKIYDGPAHGNDEAISIKYDSIDKSIVVAGNQLTDGGNNDIHAIRYRASDGGVLWQKTLLREHNDEDMFEMAMDPSGSAYITGTTTSGASLDIITFKIDWQGNIPGNATIYGTSDREDKPYGIITNYLGEVFVAGITQNASNNADYIVLKIDGDTLQSPYPMSYTNPAYTSVKLDWNDSSRDEDGFQIVRMDGACPSGDFVWDTTNAITVGTDTKTHTDTGRSSRATYCYGVRAYKGGTYSRWVNMTAVMATPPVPSPFTATSAGTTRVTLAWTPQNGGQQTGFELWRCSDSTSAACTDYTLLTSALDGTATGYDDDAVCGGTIYRYKLKAKGTGWESDFSTPVGAIPSTVDNLAVDPGFEAPNPMTTGQGIGWTNVGGTVGTDLSYDAGIYHGGAQSLNINAAGTATISGIKQYLLFAPGGKYQISAWFKTDAVVAGKVTCDLLDGGSGSFTNSGLNPGVWEQRTLTVTASTTAYPGGSRVRCYVAAGSQANIDDLQAIPLYDLTATRYSETEIDLAWIDSAFDETGYKVERCNDAGCTSPQPIATLGAGVKAYRDSRLTPDTTYWYRVRPYKTAPLSCSGGWDGGYSNIASAVATNNPPVLTASSPNTTQVNLVWTDATNTENQFQLERCSGAGCAMPPVDGGYPRSFAIGSVGYNDTAVCNNTIYNYRVRAVDHLLGLDGGKLWTNKVKLDFGATFRTNFLVRMPINQLTGMDASFKDIRFFDATVGREIPYWIETVSGSTATVWIRTGDNDNIWLYFGNSSATTTSSVTNVFGSGIVGYWPFDESVGTRTGTTADVSGLSNNAAFNTTIPSPYGVIAAGKYGNGFSMDGSTAYAKVPDTTASVFDVSGSHTIEFWYQYQPSADWTRIISKPTVSGSQPWDLYSFQMDNTVNAQKVMFRIVSGNSWANNYDWGVWQATREVGVLGPSMVSGNWYHYVGRYDYTTGRLSLFVNGVEYFTTVTPPFQIPPSNEPFTIGSRGTYGGYAKGAIDEVRMYNRALSDQEIAQRYTAVLPAVAVPDQAAVVTDVGGFNLPGYWDGPYSKPTASASVSPTQIITPKPVNLVVDPDFDNDYTSWGAGVVPTAGTSFDTAVTYSGTKSLKFTATGVTLGVSQAVAVVPNTQYVLSGYLKTALTAGQIQCDVYGTGIDSAGILSSGTSAWTYKSETVTIPVGTTAVSVRCFGNGGPQGQGWIDLVQFTPVMPITGFTAVRKSEEQVDLTWQFPSGRDQTGFRIDRCTDAGCTAVTTIPVLNADAATATPGSWKYSDRNLFINGDYWYRARAYKTEDAACNGGKGFWEAPNTTTVGPVNTVLNGPGDLTGTTSVTTACEDLRVTDTSGVAQKFYLENTLPLSACNTLNTKLIVKVASIPTAGKTLNLYYGNLKANRGDDDGTNVFNFFDDFNGTAIDTAKWKVMNGTGFSVSNGYLHGTNTTGRLGSLITTFYTSGWNLQTKVRSTVRPGGGYYPVGFSLESNYYRSFGLIDYPSAHHYSNNNNAWVANATTPPAGSSRDDNMVYSVVLKSSSLITPSIFDIDKNVTYWAPGDVANTNHTGDWNITLGRRYDDGQQGQAYTADWDWVRIRKYVDNAPTAAAPGAVAPGTYSLSGESSTWRFLRPVAVTNTSGAAQTDFQVNIVTDTTPLATDRNSLIWTATTDTETGFTLERCKDSSANCTASFAVEKTFANLPPKNSIGAQVTYLDRDLQLDSPATPITYCYRVKAVKSGGWLTAPTPGETTYSNIVCLNTKVQAAPSNFTATATGTAVNLSWTDNTTGENGFTVERCKDIDGDTPCAFTAGNKTTISLPPNDDKISTTATYVDPSLCAGTYRYRISVSKNNPDTAGTSWTLGPVYLTGDFVSTELPPAPENLIASRISDNQIRVTWKDMTADEAGFEVWRCVGSTCTNFSKLPVTVAGGSGSGSTVTYNDNYYVAPETTYRYKVRAYVNGTCTVYSGFSADNSAAAPNGPDYATASSVAPSAVTATAVNSTRADLAWTDNTVSKSDIIIGRCPGTAPCQTSYTQFAPLAASAVTYSDTSVCADTVYNYQIYPTVHTAMTPLADGQIWQGVSPLTITDFQPNFITQVVITKGAMNMQDDFRDIRFIDRDTMAALPYWIQSVSGTGSAAKAVVWFKTGANQNIDLYYGNSAATSASSKDAVFGTGLVGYWPFEEATQLPATTADASGAGNNLTLTGFTSPNGVIDNGKYGKTLSLDGNGDYAYRSSPAGLPAGNPAVASAEAWVKPTWDTALSAWSSGGYRPPYDYNGIVSWGSRNCNGGGFGMSLTSSAQAQFAGWCNDFVSPGAALVPNTWNHLAVVINGSSAITYYVNGAPITGTLTGNVPLNLASTSLVVGGLQATNQYRNFKGMIDEVRIYNRALTAQDIAARFAATIPSVSVGANSAAGAPGAASTVNLVVPHPANKVVNGEFESDLASWNVWGTTIAADAGVYFSGKKSAKMSALMTTNSSIGFWNGPFTVAAGENYTIKAAIKASLVSGSVALCRLDNSGNPDVSGREISLPATDAALNDNNWHTFSIDVTIKSGVTSANVICAIWSGTNGDGITKSTAYFDAVQLIPNPPIALTAVQVSEDAVDLNWNDLFSDETGFNIYRCQGTPCTPTAVVKQLGPGIIKYRDSGLTPGESYSYKVTAYKTATCPWESTASVVRTVTTSQIAPDLQSVTPINSTKMRLTWTDTTATETGFNIERCEGEGCTTGSPVYTEIYHNVLPASLLENSLKARYSMNGNTNDSSAGGLNLKPYYNSAQYDDGGVVFASDANFYTTTTTDILNTDYYTIEFDIKFRSSATNADVMKVSVPGGNYSPGINTSSNRLSWYNYPSGAAVTFGVNGINGTPFAIGNWYRIRGVKNGNNLKIYVDENLVANATVSNPKTAGSGTLTFGGWYTPDIVMKNVSIYNSSNAPTVRTFDDDRVCPGTTYYYRISANNQGGWGQGPASNVRNNTTMAFNPPRTPFTATTVNDVQIHLSWVANAENDQESFILKECPGASCADGVTISNVTTLDRTGLTPETNYCYQIASWKSSAYCNGGAGLTSPFTSASNCPTTLTARAGNLVAKALGAQKILLEWDDMSGDEDKFLIQKKLWNGQWVLRDISAKTPGTGVRHSFIDTIGIEPLKTYTYRVVAVKGSVESPPSNEALVTYTDPTSGQTIGTTPAFTGGIGPATCVCTEQDGKTVCK